jgi:uncharacterized membrane protein YeaQ/YmgE (transglycosylase-associated protein family)
MIGITFSAFITLLVLGFISAVVLHAFIGYRVLAGFDGFLAKWATGWIGAWLGSSVVGHWGVYAANVYIIPALVAAFVAPFLLTASVRSLGMAIKSARPELVPQTSAPSQVEMRKVS